MFFSIITYAQDNIYHPVEMEKLNEYLDVITKHQIDKLPKKHYRKKKKYYKRRMEIIKNEIKDSSFVFVPEINTQLDEIMSVIYDANPRLKQYHFYFLIDWSLMPNAGSYGDGNFVINLGLFDFVGSDDELASILCHEIAHFLSDDINTELDKRLNALNSKETKSKIRKIKYTKYGRSAAARKLAKELSFDFLDHSRCQEIDADLLGFELFNKTHYIKSAAITILDKLGMLEDIVFGDSINLGSILGFDEFPFKKEWTKEKDKLFSSSSAINDYGLNKDSLRSHPHTKKRIKMLLSKYSIDTSNHNRSYNNIYELKKSTKKISTQVLFDFGQYHVLMYNALVNIQKNKATKRDYTIIAKTLQLSYKLRKKHKLGMYILRETPFSNEKHLNKIKRFLHSVDLKDLKIIVLLYLKENKKNIETDTYNYIHKYFNS